MKKLIILTIMGVLAVITACQKHEVLEPEKNESNIKVENGILTFPDLDSFAAYLSTNEIRNYNFTSLDDIFEKIVNEDHLYDKYLEELSEEDRLGKPTYCPYFYECAEKGIINIDKLPDGSIIYNLNVAIPTMGKVLNEDGYFCIADTLYQMTKNSLKKWLKDEKFCSNQPFDEIILIQPNNESRGPFDGAWNQIRGAVSTYGSQRWMIIYYDYYTFIPPLSYERFCHIRVIYQTKTNNAWKYSARAYKWYSNWRLEGETSSNRNEGTFSGYNDYYTMWLNYGITTIGKASYVANVNEEPYGVITNFSVGTYPQIYEDWIFATYSASINYDRSKTRDQFWIMDDINPNIEWVDIIPAD